MKTHRKLEKNICTGIFLYLPLCPKKRKGTIAQLVEQRTENPCVPGSIPGGTTYLDGVWFG